MALIRFLIAALVIWLIARLAWRLLSKPKSTPAKKEVQNMVRCAQCGLHLPEQEAFAHEEQYYCCKQHLREGSKQAP